MHAIENLDELPTAPSIDPVERERLARCLFALPANEPLLHDVYASCKINSVYFAGACTHLSRYTLLRMHNTTHTHSQAACTSSSALWPFTRRLLVQILAAWCRCR